MKKEHFRSEYEVVYASDFEIGLTKNGVGIRTWWIDSFGDEVPTIAHPIIKKCIDLHESNSNPAQHGGKEDER